ncbi:Cold-shock protein DNA-binding protein [Flexistipes sinusarabici DSM 4947]|uniref:Cold-shock protein DNA-binding protein n=1 Tax=Flexistipes sinusarabici (strain ATCC 49648 / DSM 4947 / MAS 10) TaxID=717231 RepID=F8E7K9_FLESM|nr:cold-shock protein [Flexistipes sinusarabici]AEI14996.1 Cold-shock protein DNA-binding protein [Flexistipes sinusarabici DSM 4947]
MADDVVKTGFFAQNSTLNKCNAAILSGISIYNVMIYIGEDMEQLQELRKKANNLKDNRKYEQATEIYKQIIDNHESHCNDWDYWNYAFCLKKQRMYNAASEICKSLLRINKDFVPAKNLLCWCLFYSKIKNKKSEDEFLEASRKVLKLCIQKDKYSPYTITVFKVLEHFKHKNDYPAEKILKCTNMLDPELLNVEPYRIKENDKEIELASQLELYFMHRTKALLNCSKYDQCINECEHALKSLNKFHYNNDIWFKWRMALSYKALAKYKESIEGLYEIATRKKDWFILKEISENLYHQNKVEEAFMYAVKACLRKGDIDKKLSLFLLIADILINLNDKVNAQKHVDFVYHFKIKEQKETGAYLNNLISANNFEISEDLDLDMQYKQLVEFWTQIKASKQKRYAGFIKKLLPNRKSGFIEASDGKTYYFQIRNIKNNPANLHESQKVTFCIEDGFDAKKNKPSKIAVEIKTE